MRFLTFAQCSANCILHCETEQAPVGLNRAEEGKPSVVALLCVGESAMVTT